MLFKVWHLKGLKKFGILNIRTMHYIHFLKYYYSVLTVADRLLFSKCLSKESITKEPYTVYQPEERKQRKTSCVQQQQLVRHTHDLIHHSSNI